MFRPCRPVNCIERMLDGLVCNWWRPTYTYHTYIIYIRRYLYRIQVRRSNIWKCDIWAIKIQLTQCLPLYAHTETIHKWACFRFVNTNILHVSYRTNQVRQSCTAQQSYDELTLSCPVTLGRIQVHWKVPHSSPPSGPPHSHVVCRDIFAQQVNAYREMHSLVQRRITSATTLRTLKQQRLTLFLGTWLHLLPVTFPAASETPQQTPSDNEQECTQSDTHSYTHTHTHAWHIQYMRTHTSHTVTRVIRTLRC